MDTVGHHFLTEIENGSAENGFQLRRHPPRNFHLVDRSIDLIGTVAGSYAGRGLASYVQKRNGIAEPNAAIELVAATASHLIYEMAHARFVHNTAHNAVSSIGEITGFEWGHHTAHDALEGILDHWEAYLYKNGITTGQRFTQISDKFTNHHFDSHQIRDRHRVLSHGADICSIAFGRYHGKMIATSCANHYNLDLDSNAIRLMSLGSSRFYRKFISDQTFRTIADVDHFFEWLNENWHRTI